MGRRKKIMGIMGFAGLLIIVSAALLVHPLEGADMGIEVVELLSLDDSIRPGIQTPPASAVTTRSSVEPSSLGSAAPSHQFDQDGEKEPAEEDDEDEDED